MGWNTIFHNILSVTCRDTLRTAFLLALAIHVAIPLLGTYFPADYPFGDYSDKLLGTLWTKIILLRGTPPAQLAPLNQFFKYPGFYAVSTIFSLFLPIELGVVLAYVFFISLTLFLLPRDRFLLGALLLLIPVAVTTQLLIGRLPHIIGILLFSVGLLLILSGEMQRGVISLLLSATMHAMFLPFVAAVLFAFVYKARGRERFMAIVALALLALLSVIYKSMSSGVDVALILSRGHPINLPKHVIYFAFLISLGVLAGRARLVGIGLALFYGFLLILGFFRLNPFFLFDMRALFASVLIVLIYVFGKNRRALCLVLWLLFALAVVKIAYVLLHSPLLRGTSVTLCLRDLANTLPPGTIVVTCRYHFGTWSYSFAPSAYLQYVNPSLVIVSNTPELASVKVMRYADDLCSKDHTSGVLVVRVEEYCNLN